MGKLIDRLERLLYGATTEERVNRMADRMAELVARRAEARLVAALDLPDEAHRCPACAGEGYVLAAGGPGEMVCIACEGSGLRESSEKVSGGDGA
jgi:hypothetical protein